MASRKPPTSPPSRRRRDPPRRSPLQETYEVGHRKPPKKHRFKPGKSANPAGRPPELQRPHRLVMDAAFNRRITIVIDGKRRRVTVFEAMFLKMMQDAANGDARARRDLFKLAKDFGYQPPPLGMGTLLEAFVGVEGALPEPATRWLVELDRLATVLIEAGLLQASEIGGVIVSQVLFDHLAALELPVRKRRPLLRGLKAFLRKDDAA